MSKDIIIKQEIKSKKPKKAEIPKNQLYQESIKPDRCATHFGRLFFERAIMKKLTDTIQWGLPSQENRPEEGGLLLGQPFQTKAKTYFAIVKEIVKANTSDAGPTHLVFNQHVWQQLQEDADRLIARDLDLQTIGWYHTHPNQLSLEFSHTDRKTQKEHFNQDWMFAVVLNPDRKIWAVYQGENAQSCIGSVFKDKNYKKPEPKKTFWK